MQPGTSDRIAAWIAACLAAVWAALLVPLVATGGLAIIIFPFVLGMMVVVGLPLALLGKKLGWTGWVESAAAGALAGFLPIVVIVATTRDVRPDGDWLSALAIFVLPGMVAGLTFRLVLGRYRIVGRMADAEREGYDYRPSPWPLAAVFLVITAAGLAIHQAFLF